MPNAIPKNAALYNLTSSMSTLRMHRPTYTPTKGHVWPVTFDPTSAFISSKKPSNVATDDTPMDVETPAGGGTPSATRGGSLQPPNQPTNRSDDTYAQMQITMPLLHAIRTTAAHMNATSPLLPVVPSATQASRKQRIIRNAMEIAFSSHPGPDSKSTESLIPKSNEPPSDPSGTVGLKSSPSDGMTLSIDTSTALNTTAKRVSTPGTQASTPTSLDTGTPTAEKGAVKKKKKRESCEKVKTSIISPLFMHRIGVAGAAAQSPTAPPMFPS